MKTIVLEDFEAEVLCAIVGEWASAQSSIASATGKILARAVSEIVRRLVDAPDKADDGLERQKYREPATFTAGPTATTQTATVRIVEKPKKKRKFKIGYKALAEKHPWLPNGVLMFAAGIGYDLIAKDFDIASGHRGVSAVLRWTMPLVDKAKDIPVGPERRSFVYKACGVEPPDVTVGDVVAHKATAGPPHNSGRTRSGEPLNVELPVAERRVRKPGGKPVSLTTPIIARLLANGFSNAEVVDLYPLATPNQVSSVKAAYTEEVGHMASLKTEDERRRYALLRWGFEGDLR